MSRGAKAVRRDGRITSIVGTKKTEQAEGGPAADAGRTASSERALAAGELLFEIGDAPEAAYFVRSGELDLLNAGPGDVFRLADRIGPGACAGGIDVLAGRERPFRARASSDVRLVEVDAETFRAMCAERPGIALRLLEQQAHRTDDLERRLSAVGADDLVRPVVFALLAAAEAAERGMRVPTTLRELSSQCGLSLRETHRGLQQLFEAKQVRLHDDALWIPEPETLRAQLDGTPLGVALSG